MPQDHHREAALHVPITFLIGFNYVNAEGECGLKHHLEHE